MTASNSIARGRIRPCGRRPSGASDSVAGGKTLVVGRREPEAAGGLRPRVGGRGLRAALVRGLSGRLTRVRRRRGGLRLLVALILRRDRSRLRSRGQRIRRFEFVQLAFDVATQLLAVLALEVAKLFDAPLEDDTLLLEPAELSPLR